MVAWAAPARFGLCSSTLEPLTDQDLSVGTPVELTWGTQDHAAAKAAVVG